MEQLLLHLIGDYVTQTDWMARAKVSTTLAALCHVESVNGETLKYLNRLSDALFVMARFENHARDVGDVLWDSRA